MFTGIIEETGTVEAISSSRRGSRLMIGATRSARGLKIGDSLAVNGSCLTVISIGSRGRRKQLQFDLLRETWVRTNLQFVRKGSQVNLERPVRADGRWDGHFVTGHVDGIGRIERLTRSGADHVLDIAAPPAIRRFLIDKGSIAVDGISLTIAEVTRTGFRIWIIPHTWEVTALRERKQGDAVNLEADVLGKYVAKLLPSKFRSASGRKADGEAA